MTTSKMRTKQKLRREEKKFLKRLNLRIADLSKIQAFIHLVSKIQAAMLREEFKRLQSPDPMEDFLNFVYALEAVRHEQDPRKALAKFGAILSARPVKIEER